MGDQKFTYPEPLWAGTEHSLQIAMEAHASMMAGLFSAQQPDEDEEEPPYNFSMQGNVGIVTVRGPLVNRDSYWNRYAGVTSYADVRRAMIYAANKPEAKAILLDIDSGGGAVSGVADAGNLIKQVATVKNVYAFSDGTMASAAYWLGSSATKVYASKTSLMGSIGVIATHTEYSKALKAAGIGVTVIRAGEFKALGHPAEPLSDKALAIIQGQLNDAYKVFAEHVVEARGTTMAHFEATMGQGREFFGAAAVDAGLADGLTTFDGLISKIEANLLDSEAGSHNNLSNFQKRNVMPRDALTQQQLAAIAAGAPAAAAASAPAAAPAADKPAADTSTETTEIPEAVAAAVKPSAEAAGADQVVAYLQGQVKDKDAQLLAQAVELKGAKDKVTSMEATHGELVKIAAQSLSNMRIALGGSAVDAGAMTAEQLLAEHAGAAKTFGEKFKAGGVAAASNTEAEAAAKPALDANYLLRVQATLGQPKK